MTHCYIDRYVTKTCAKTLKILRSITKWWDWFVHWVIKMAWIYCNFLPSWLLLLHTELCMECTITHPHWYMTSVRYRGQILICGFDVMISLAQSSRSGITIYQLATKVSPAALFMRKFQIREFSWQITRVFFTMTLTSLQFAQAVPH